jgi:signal transduction histidine kinase
MMARPARKGRAPRLDSSRQLADYATAFDFLGKLAGATTEESVVENVFDLFTLLFAPSTVIYLSVRDGEPQKTMSRSSVGLDVEAAKASMLRLDAGHALTPSGEGFDVAIGHGPTREIVRVEGVCFVEYRDHYLNLALNVVPVLGLALTNARRFQQIQALGARIQAVSSASNVVSESLANLPREKIEGVLRTIAAQAQRLTGAEHVALGLGTDPEKQFDPWVFVGTSPGQAAAIGRHPRPVGMLGVVARGCETIRLRDLTRHPSFGGFPTAHPAMTSLLGVPIRLHDRVVGHLFLANERGERAFTDEDQALVEMLAARAGLALETARLYEAERTQRAWLEAVVEQMPDAVKLLDAEGRVAMLNRAATALRCADDGRRDPFGNRVDLDLWTPSGDRLPPEALPHVRALSRGEPLIGKELRIRTPAGGLLPVLASAVAVHDPSGAPLGATVVFRDLSAQKELERMRTEWSAVIAHDLRQPASVIALAVGLARQAHPGAMADVEAKQLDRIEAAGRRLSAMIDELLDATRLEVRQLSIAPSLVDVAGLAREVCERTANVTAGRPVSVCEAGVVRKAWADPTRVEQVLANLVSNAAKYGAPGTEIRVDVQGHDDHVEVTVTNQGRGIAPEELPRLFQRFARSRASVASGTPGIGLGLYICKGLIEAHGGRIWAESTPGETTSFHFTLPCTAGATSA